MKISCKALILLLLAGLFIGVAQADEVSDQAKSIYILVDRNITAETTYVDSRNQIADWWQVDLVKVLTKKGDYDAKLIQKQEEFIPAPNAYLLKAKIVQYNPGSKSARIIIGMGAGACSMDLHLELFGMNNNQIFAKDDHVASTRDWKNVARKLNKNTLAAIDEALSPASVQQ